MAAIKSKRCFDVIAVVREISDTRTPVGHPPVANVCLVDGTETNKGKTAEVVVAVWGTENITLCQKHVGEPLLFLNVAAKHAGELELNLWTDRLIAADCQCEKMDSLKTKAAETGFADDREVLTSQRVNSWDPDGDTEVDCLPSCLSEGNPKKYAAAWTKLIDCLLYTSPSPRDLSTARMPSSA